MLNFAVSELKFQADNPYPYPCFLTQQRCVGALGILEEAKIQSNVDTRALIVGRLTTCPYTVYEHLLG